jgi:carbonic anhydrase
VDFRERLLTQYAARFRELADGQSPDTLFITCADSRVLPHLLLSMDVGELFVVRNVGNLVPPATAEGHSTGDLSEASAIEYAVSVLKVANVVVCGHSSCGALKAVSTSAALDDAPNLGKWLHHATPAARRLRHDGPFDPRLKQYDQLSQHNVLVQLDHLMTYPLIKEQVGKGALLLSGWWFEVATGDMYAYDPESRVFALIDRAFADRSAVQVQSRD